ncbi:MAG: ATP-binding cassette domain-containing protein [Pseudomonadales bacterium]|nr:ATP-binding cassette domain-containing protein [Pseudomonadales bacterium]
MTALLKVSNAMCRVGRHNVLRIEQFQIEQGQHWCLFGPNGAGKTLLANLISGKRIESGKYVDYGDEFDPARDIQLVSFEEQQKLWEKDNRLDISEYQADAQDAGTLVCDLISGSRDAGFEDQGLFDELIEDLNLDRIRNKGIRFLSSGQIRKVLIARALYAYHPDAPQLLILDDPLESIDVDSKERIENCIDKYLHAGFSSIQLCRRSADILPGVTNIALMQDLTIVEQGQRESVEKGDRFKDHQQQAPSIPQQLPKNYSEDEELQDYEASSLIELTAVNANYGELEVLKDLSWSMLPDQHVLIEGPNGCGKSTLLSLIDGENHKAYGQEVSLFDRKRGSGETVWEVKAKFGVVSNELHNKYVKGWKVLDVVVSGFFDSVGLYDDSGTKEIEIASEWLDALGIEALAKHYYHEISFGQQRLVLLARAMVKQPRILILDEPCVGLDDYHRELILGVLDRIAEQTKTKIIYVSHVRDEKPLCINRRLSFEPNNSGGYKIAEYAV